MNQYDFHPDGVGLAPIHDFGVSPRAVTFPREATLGTSTTNHTDTQSSHLSELPLSGIRVIIIHVKDTLKDGPHVSENILAQLNEYEARLQEQGAGLGCEFVISQSGESYWF